MSNKNIRKTEFSKHLCQNIHILQNKSNQSIGDLSTENHKKKLGSSLALN